MTPPDVLCEGLALVLLDGDWEAAAMSERGCRALGTDVTWMAALCTRVLDAFPVKPADVDAVAAMISVDDQFRELSSDGQQLELRKWFFPEATMWPIDGPPARFAVPPIATEGDLAAFVGVTPLELDWFADTTRRNAARVDPRLRHYHYRWVPKRSGGFRLLETPKPRLAAMQRAILANVLDHLPPSAAAHGFVRARSPLSFVAPHVGQRVVLRLDLEDFFSSVSLTRVRAIFRRVGYPPQVAHKLAGLCCVPTPSDVIRAKPRGAGDPATRFHESKRLQTAHLPQGAPTSPALSNLVALRLDRRLAGLARKAGVNFTRYADDLAFSGTHAFERALSTFIPHVAAIASEEGFRVRYRKTRVMRAGVRQHLAGLVLNQRVNVPRAEYEALRALLHNAAQFGPDSQNRAQHPQFRAHLLGRIALGGLDERGASHAPAATVRGDRLGERPRAVAPPARQLNAANDTRNTAPAVRLCTRPDHRGRARRTPTCTCHRPSCTALPDAPSGPRDRHRNNRARVQQSRSADTFAF